MRKYAALPLSLAAALVFGLFAGCSQGASPSTAESTAGDSQVVSTDSAASPTADGDSRSIEIWCWDLSEPRMKSNSAFTEQSGVEVKLTAVESKDMAQKLQTTLAAGGDMPDIAWLEATFRGKLLSLDIWEDITAEPYNYSKDDMLDYLIPLETSPNGNYVGPECPSVAGMAYKRELALEYFGTDDPAELEKLLPDWDAFVEAGKGVQEKSGGKVFMMSSLGLASIMLKGQTTEPFVIGDKLNLDASMRPILERLIELKANGICDVLDRSSPEEGASYAGNDHIFYPCASWSVEFTIKANDRDGEGRWAFMLPPDGPFPWGGTVTAVPQKAKNKVDAVEFIKFFFATVEGSKIELDAVGNFSPYKPVYEIEDFYDFPDPYFGGQNVVQEIATRVLPNIGGVRVPNQYDQDVDDVLNLAIKSINASDGTSISVDELIASMEDDLLNKQATLTK